MIEPPNDTAPPKWARDLVTAANVRNRARGSNIRFSMEDLAAVWRQCGGKCSVSGLHFRFTVVGDGQAKRPYAPSLDRKNRHLPYTRENVRLVTSVANFAMNAWGLPPLLELALAIHEQYGTGVRPIADGPPDAGLAGEAIIDADRVNTSEGSLPYPGQADRIAAVLDLLKDGPLCSRKIEILSAGRFSLTDEQRHAEHPNRMPIWRNLVAHALRALVTRGEIERIAMKSAPDGGTSGIYQRRK